MPSSSPSKSHLLTISISQPSPGAASVASSQKSTRRRKKQQPVHTLEEVFNQVSSATESSLNAPPGRVVLTPRSAEACLKLGVNPEILKIRDIDSFWEPGIDAAVQRLRHEAYVQRRHDTMKACRLERKRIINAAFDAHGGFEPGNEGLTPEQLLKQQQEQSSTLIQMELARIEKMQKRQEKELEQMIQYEINRAKLQEDMTQRIEEARRREEFKRRVVAEARRKLLQEHAAALRGFLPRGVIVSPADLEILKAFDGNKDGELNAEEMALAQAAFQAFAPGARAAGAVVVRH